MVCNIEDIMHYLPEFLNSLSSFGLSPHDLMLKFGIPIMLLRNLSPSNTGNGTRLLIKEFWDKIIVATILTGPAVGQLAYIPWIVDTHDSERYANIVQKAAFSNQSFICPHDK